MKFKLKTFLGECYDLWTRLTYPSSSNDNITMYVCHTNFNIWANLYQDTEGKTINLLSIFAVLSFMLALELRRAFAQVMKTPRLDFSQKSCFIITCLVPRCLCFIWKLFYLLSPLYLLCLGNQSSISKHFHHANSSSVYRMPSGYTELYCAYLGREGSPLLTYWPGLSQKHIDKWEK